MYLVYYEEEGDVKDVDFLHDATLSHNKNIIKIEENKPKYNGALTNYI